MGDGGTAHLFQRLRSLVGGGSERVLYECRHCGASVDGPGDKCPDCGTCEIARFLI